MENKNSIDEVDKGDDSEDESHVIKQCKFDKYGYCNRGATNCGFFHSLETCEIYLDTGFCNKETCRKRHPKLCYYFGNGFCKHGEKCRFLHQNEPPQNKCDKCERHSVKNYFCEFCTKNYCQHCIVKEAHTENVYCYEEVGCKNIHI